MRKDFLSTFIIALALLLLHFTATALDLFWTTWWADVFAHSIGGILIASLIWNIRKDAYRSRPLMVLSIALVIGVLWEVFELEYNLISLSDPDFWPDTLSDLSFDSLGAILGYFYLTKRQGRL